MSRATDVTFNPLRDGPLDEARIRRVLADLGFPQADTHDEIERAKRTGATITVASGEIPPDTRRPHA